MLEEVFNLIVLAVLFETVPFVTLFNSLDCNTLVTQ